MTKTSAEEMVYAAIDEVNATADNVALAKARDTILLGEDEGIDSLVVVSLVVALETQISACTGKVVVLIDEDIFDNDKHPLRTVGSLIEFPEDILKR